MKAVLNAYGRALLSQLHGKMLVLSIVPFLLSVALWAVLLYFCLQPMVDYVHLQFVERDLFDASAGWLNTLGLGVLRTVLPPLIAMLTLLPLMILTALIFIGVAAMPFVVRHVGGRHYSQLEKKRGGSIAGSVVAALGGFVIFVLAWFVALPLYFFPPAALLVQVLLWGWLTCRVMTYDALADYASAEERAQLRRAHRWQLLAIGVVSGAAGAIPGVVWVGGATLAVVFFPFLAAISVWLYIVIFIFTGLWFEYYCLEALQQQRAQAAGGAATTTAASTTILASNATTE